MVYVLNGDGESKDLISSRGVTHVLPREGIL